MPRRQRASWGSNEDAGRGKRVKILVEEERYMVVLESRERYWLLITAFYFQDDRKLMRTLNEDQKKGAVKAGSAISALPEGSFHTR